MKLQVKIIPNASKNEILGTLLDGTIKIKIKAQPREGKANTELINYLSEYFSLSRSEIKIIRGEKMRLKIIELQGIDEKDSQRIISLINPHK